MREYLEYEQQQTQEQDAQQLQEYQQRETATEQADGQPEVTGIQRVVRQEETGEQATQPAAEADADQPAQRTPQAEPTTRDQRITD